MVKLVDINPIESAIENRVIELPDNEYIGMSGIGDPCKRKIWYDFRWASKRTVQPRIQRIFERGNIEEPRVIRDLIKAGMRVHSEQLEYVDDTGHIRGHIDGIVENVPGAEKTPHLLEIKTMNDERFKQYIKVGLQASNPVYYVQMHSYMGAFKLSRCLYVITNKDTEERKYHRYHYKKEVYEDYKRIAMEILTSEAPPPKAYDQYNWICKVCNHYEVCQRSAVVRKTCRTCANVDIALEGKFNCAFLSQPLSYANQQSGCEQYDKDSNV